MLIGSEIMVFITFSEVIDLVVMIAALGFIFMESIRLPYVRASFAAYKPGIQEFITACLITAPAIVLHEFAHKIVGLLFGMGAVFHASYGGLALGIFLRLIHSPFIIFAPGYVALSGAGSPFVTAVTAFAGPAMNLLLWFGSKMIIKNKRRLTQRQFFILQLTRQVNIFLFFFNMIPLPPFDGSKVVFGLMEGLF